MAVQWIGSLSDAELLDYLPQLVQVGGLASPLVPKTPSQSAACPLEPRVSRFQAVHKALLGCLLSRP